MKISVISVPLNLGRDREGIERAPNHPQERGLMELIRGNGHRALDLGNLCMPPISEADKFIRGDDMKYLDIIVEVNNNLAELIYNTLRGGASLLVTGRDHPLGLESASGVGKCYDDFGIIWLGVHGDIDISEMSPNGNIHGMSLNTLVGMGNGGPVNAYTPGNKVNPQNVFLVRTRSLDEGEWSLIEREKPSVYTMETIHLEGIGFVAEDTKRKLKEWKIRSVHFSIDVDSIDPRLIPDTRTCVCEGLMPDEFNNSVDHALSTNLVKSIDLVGLNPELDANGQTTSLCLEIIDYITARLQRESSLFRHKPGARSSDDRPLVYRPILFMDIIAVEAIA